MSYKLDDILKKEEKEKKEKIASQQVNEEIVKDFMQNPAYTKSKNKTKKKQENKINENDKFDSLIRKIVISFLSTAGIVLISSLLIKFIFILFS